ncbi:glycoside hydrolase family 76 protein [Hyaloscypha variabilis]|jgi:hypothetical protein
MRFSTNSLHPYLIFLPGAFAIPTDFSVETSHVKRDVVPEITPRQLGTSQQSFPAMVNALEVMQSEFWGGSNWPLGIDWTEAVFNQIEWAALNSIARYGGASAAGTVNQYYSQLLNFYNGEDVTAIMNEKYDDMQWVVLEWLEAIKFLTLYENTPQNQNSIAEFAHRARSFWDAASQGWNTTLCGGGMVWTWTLLPYKNAITNELYVSSSIGMYLYSPADSIGSPPVPAHDPKYLNAAVEAYKWLSTIGLTNSQGLYVDGFHIAGYQNASDPGTGNCDQRDEDVYTYNQGVVLSGLRGLWDATGEEFYLDDGHTLVSNVIAATGWISSTEQNSTWSGLGSNGTLQDVCDVTNSCSQDGQNFKGVFFSHFTSFCEPLAVGQAEGIIFKGTIAQAQAHQAKCDSYKDWVQHNAQAAYRTRNTTGVYGGNWNVPATDAACASPPQQPAGSSDYRNKGIPSNWTLPGLAPPAVSNVGLIGTGPSCPPNTTDPNTLGRGRTPETQSGGLAVMMALVQAEESS